MSPANARQNLRWGSLEWFVIIIYMSSALFFLPGAQSFRTIIRAAPYVTSILFLFLQKSHRTGSDRRYGRVVYWLYASFVFLAFGLILPQANRVIGTAQMVLQLSIAAPFFWMRSQYCTERRVERLIYLILLCNGASATVGVLQAYNPERFMPPEMTSLGIQLNKDLIDSLSYTRSDGSLIVRPPGLTDLPGGAANGAGLSVLFGVAVAFRPGTSVLWRSIGLTLTVIGMFCLYLTGVRYMTIMTIIAGGFLGFLFLRQGRLLESIVLLGGGSVLTVLTFAYAIAFGGSDVRDRFGAITEAGLLSSFQSERGYMLQDTITNMVFEYPIGAGSGKHGMMYVYFSNYEAELQPLIWAEIQITGWLLDGGIPLVVAYYGAIFITLFSLYSLAARIGDRAESFHASVAFCLGMLVLGSTFAGPTFNTAAGLQFWFVSGLILREATLRQQAKRQALAQTKVKLGKNIIAVPRLKAKA